MFAKCSPFLLFAGAARTFDGFAHEGKIDSVIDQKLRLIDMHMYLRICVAFCFLTLTTNDSRGQDSGVELFEKKIRPALVEHCYKCHSRQAGKERGGLLLDTRDAMRRGGDNGPTIVPGKPAESLLIQSMRHTKADLKMPKGYAEVAGFRRCRFRTMGGNRRPDPRGEKAIAKGIDFDAARKHWAYRPIPTPQKMTVKIGTASPIDHFIAAQLTDKGLKPSPMADAAYVDSAFVF